MTEHNLKITVNAQERQKLEMKELLGTEGSEPVCTFANVGADIPCWGRKLGGPCPIVLVAIGAGLKGTWMARHWVKLTQHGEGEAMGQLGLVGQLKAGRGWGGGEVLNG